MLGNCHDHRYGFFGFFCLFSSNIKKDGEIKPVVKLQVYRHLPLNADKHENIYMSISKIEAYMEGDLTLGGGKDIDHVS